MSQDQKPREFWITRNGMLNNDRISDIPEIPLFKNDIVYHVIEYSYAMKLQDELIKTTNEWLDINERTNKDLKAERARAQKLREALQTAQRQLEVCGDFFEFSRVMNIPSKKEHRDFAKESAKNIEKALAFDVETNERRL